MLALFGREAVAGKQRVYSRFQPLAADSSEHAKASVRVFEDVFSDRELRAIEAEVEAYLDVRRQSIVNDGDHIQVTRFVANGDEPRCAIEAAVSTLASGKVTGADQSDGFCGCEWWIQHRKADEPQAFHVDADVGLQIRGGDDCDGES